MLLTFIISSKADSALYNLII